MTPLVKCWPILRSGARRVFKHHHRLHRIGHHARRLAGIAAGKPSGLVIVCVAVSGLGGDWARTSQQPVQPYTEMSPTSGGGLGALGGFVLPGEFDTAALIPPGFGPLGPEFFELPPSLPPQFEIVGPPVLLPELPGGEVQPAPVPEPSSLAVLATGIAAGLVAIALIQGKV